MVHGIPKPVEIGRASKSAEIEIGCCFSAGDGWRVGNAMSNPLKTGGAGRSAKTEIGRCFFSSDDGRVGSLTKDIVGGSFFSEEEERVGTASFWILISLAFSSRISDRCSCFSRFKCSISVSLSFSISCSR